MKREDCLIFIINPVQCILCGNYLRESEKRSKKPLFDQITKKGIKNHSI